LSTDLEKANVISTLASLSTLEREAKNTFAIDSFIERLTFGTIACLTQLEGKKVETCGLLTELQWEVSFTFAGYSSLEKPGFGVFAIITTLKAPKTLGRFIRGYPLEVRM